MQETPKVAAEHVRVAGFFREKKKTHAKKSRERLCVKKNAGGIGKKEGGNSRKQIRIGEKVGR